MLGERIKSRRLELGMTQQELATKVGYSSRSAINKIEKGFRDINQSQIISFSKALETTPEVLLGWEDPHHVEGIYMSSEILNREREIFAKKLNFYMQQNNITQADISNKFGITASTVSDWCKGKKYPRIDKVQMLADYFGVLKSDLTEDNSPDKNESSGKLIPVLGTVAAGVPIMAAENILDYEEISESMAQTGEFFALQIKGNSMEPKISEGDIVIVRKQEDVESGQVAIVLVNGDDATCKKFVKHENGVSLVSYNPSYPPMFFTRDEIGDKPIRIIGRVVELRAKL